MFDQFYVYKPVSFFQTKTLTDHKPLTTFKLIDDFDKLTLRGTVITIGSHFLSWSL